MRLGILASCLSNAFFLRVVIVCPWSVTSVSKSLIENYLFGLWLVMDMFWLVFRLYELVVRSVTLRGGRSV